jgi:hypothetical protein
MACPNCGSCNTWDDNLHWGCDDCDWSSLAGLNSTRTPSAPYSFESDPTEVTRRERDWAERDARDAVAGAGDIAGDPAAQG